MNPPIDLKGKRFGSLIADQITRRGNKRAWSCTCDCGNTTTVITGNLTHGYVTSCGCKRKANQ